MDAVVFYVYVHGGLVNNETKVEMSNLSKVAPVTLDFLPDRLRVLLYVTRTEITSLSHTRVCPRPFWVMRLSFPQPYNYTYIHTLPTLITGLNYPPIWYLLQHIVICATWTWTYNTLNTRIQVILYSVFMGLPHQSPTRLRFSHRLLVTLDGVVVVYAFED